MWFFCALAAHAATSPDTSEPSAELLQALVEHDSQRIDALLIAGLDPWPTLDRLRRVGELDPEVAPVLRRVVDAASVTPDQVAVPGRSAEAEVAWLDTQLIEMVTEPLLCVGVASGDAWLVAEAIRRGEVPATCDGTSVTLASVQHPEVLALVLDAGAPVDACALSEAVRADVVASVDRLLSVGASPRHGCGMVPIWAARSEAVVGSLVHAGVDAFDPALGIEDHLRSWLYARPALQAPTAHSARRDELVAWAWAAGVDDPDAFRTHLPAGWDQVPHRALPGVQAAPFAAAWRAAGGANALLTARTAPLGSALPSLPCAVPTSTSDAKASLGELERTLETETHRFYVSDLGHYEQRAVDGRWETESWSAPLSSCPALASTATLLPALLGSYPWLTADGAVLGIEGDRLTVVLPAR